MKEANGRDFAARAHNLPLLWVVLQNKQPDSRETFLRQEKQNDQMR